MLNEKYWTDRYIQGQTGWDIGYSNPAIIEFFKKKVDKNSSIAIPGCGMSYEGYDLWKLGFESIQLFDISEEAKKAFLHRFPDFPENRYTVGDFFEMDHHFDVMVEQTFFCALDPKMRTKYVEKMSQSLNPSGILVGVLFSVEMPDGPPFGGSLEEYVTLFSPYFEIQKMELAYNNIPQRSGREFFVKMLVK